MVYKPTLCHRCGEQKPRNKRYCDPCRVLQTQKWRDHDRLRQRLRRKSSPKLRKIKNRRKILIRNKKLKASIIQQQGGGCNYCGTSRHLEYDHIVPICRGGGDEISNLQVLCRTCNHKKGQKC